MKRVIAIAVLAACGSPADPPPQTFTFGPFSLAPGDELLDQCVSATLHNTETLYVSSVELSTGVGFHHSNWFWVPESTFPGDDGTWSCNARGFTDVIAGVKGGVLFAQSTQATHEVQAFPPGAAIPIPPNSKIVAGTHLLDATDMTLSVPLAITLTSIARDRVTKKLAAISFEDEALGLPPHRKSRFTIECEIGPTHRVDLGREPDFSIYYALPHYHTLGTGLLVEAIRSDGGADTVFSTAMRIGDALGGPLSPPFSMTGYQNLRFTCTYDNPSDATIGWGYGGKEMCVFLGFTDSPDNWAGGALVPDNPGTGTDDGTSVNFSHSCTVVATEANL